MQAQPLRIKLNQHIPVLQKEVIENLKPQKNENFIDATLGYAGHAKEILEKISPNGQLLGIDQDNEAIQAAQKNLEKYKDRLALTHSNFNKLGLIVRYWPVKSIDGILIDLGASTPQLTGGRGFSFMVNAPLDMRMNPKAQHITAEKILNEYSQKDLLKIFRELGEDRFAFQIARKIVDVRQKKRIEKTFDLVEIIKSATPPAYRFSHKTHFATNIFRALRMEVNQELDNLKSVLPQAVKILSSGGRIGIITFHSLEDRIVKQFLRDNEELEVLTSKPIIPTPNEIINNPPSRSAKLRVAKKI